MSAICHRVHQCEQSAQALQLQCQSLQGALQQLFQVCLAMDAEVQDDRPEESAYQAALAFAANVLGVPWPPAGWPYEVPDAAVTRTTGFLQVIDPPRPVGLRWEEAAGDLNTEGRA